MKFLNTGFLCLLLFLSAARSAAQIVPHTKDVDVKKPELFRDLPSRMDVNALALAPLLQKEVGDRVMVSLHSGFLFSGIVVSKSAASEVRYKTVVLKATDRPGAAFTITAVRKPDGTYRYSGRLLSLQHSDAFELVEERGQLALEKKELAELVSE
jgi:hypothetical protein